MLIQIDEENIINSEEIKSASRCGMYTDITFKDGMFKSILDEYYILWQKIEAAAK